MQKPSLENKQLLNDIEALYSCLKEAPFSKDAFIQYIFTLLVDTYNLCVYIDQKFILKDTIVKFEKDKSNIDSFIEKYTLLSDKALENEDENLYWRYKITLGTFEIFKNNPDKAIVFLRGSISSNLLLTQKEFFNIYIKILESTNPNSIEALFKNYNNQDLFIDLYGLFEGYHISQQKIIKSSALKIFNYCHLLSKVKKNLLAQKIEFIFSTLAETLSLDAKRASDIRPIGEFKGMILLDYGSNKQSILEDFGLSEIISRTLKSVVNVLKQTKQKEIISQINNNLKTLEPLFIGKLLS